MRISALLLTCSLSLTSYAQGPVAVLEGRPSADSELGIDLQTFLGDPEPLVIRLVSEGSSLLTGPSPLLLLCDDVKSADSRALSDRVRSAPSLILEDGSLIDWFNTLHRSKRATRLLHAIQRHSREGKPLVGIAGGAAALAGAGVVLSSELGEIPRNPHRDEALQVRVGLGWGPPTLIEASRWGADRGLHLMGGPMRTLRLMERSYMKSAAHLGEGAGLIYEPIKSQIRVIGGGHVLFFETSSGHRNRHELRGGRVSLLLRGDILDLSHDRLTASSQTPLLSRATHSFNKFLMEFASSPTTKPIFSSRHGHLLLRQRDDTQIIKAGALARPLRAEFDLINSP